RAQGDGDGRARIVAGGVVLRDPPAGARRGVVGDDHVVDRVRVRLPHGGDVHEVTPGADGDSLSLQVLLGRAGKAVDPPADAGGGVDGQGDQVVVRAIPRAA